MISRRDLSLGITGLGLSGCAQRPFKAVTDDKTRAFLAAAKAQTKHWVNYRAHYQKLAYPMGDVPANEGVCADVIIRAFRGIGLDLQALVHEDMVAHFDLYPNRWGLKSPDANIDHRRVPNLEVFFSRFAKVLPATNNPHDYLPGDILTTRPITRPHIVIISDQKSWFGPNPMVIQNMGFGVRQDDDFMRGRKVGHYRFGI